MTLTRPWTLNVQNTYSGLNNTTTGSFPDAQVSSRPLPIHTPKLPWRPPTPYWRTEESGYLHTYACQVSERWQLDSNPKHLGIVNFSGASDAHGFHYANIPSPPSNLENQAIIKARLKLKDMNVNLSQAFAERHQTIALISDSIDELRQTVRSIKHGRLPQHFRGSRANEYWFRRWLELQYGWKPLLADCYGSVAALHESEKRRENKGMVTVRAKVHASEYDVKTISDIQNNAHWRYDRVRKIKHDGWIRLDFTQSDSPPVRELSALGITNPAELAWELLPWSFVADWFIPIGDYLSSLDATLGWDFKGGSYSSKTTVHQHVNNGTAYAVGGQTNFKGSAICYGSGRQMQFTRKVYGSAPLPQLPSFHKVFELSGDHIANGIALLTQAILSGQPRYIR